MILPLFFNCALLPVGKGSGVRGRRNGGNCAEFVGC